jgi:hypothetical protein
LKTFINLFSQSAWQQGLESPAAIRVALEWLLTSGANQPRQLLSRSISAGNMLEAIASRIVAFLPGLHDARLANVLCLFEVDCVSGTLTTP